MATADSIVGAYFLVGDRFVEVFIEFEVVDTTLIRLVTGILGVCINPVVSCKQRHMVYAIIPNFIILLFVCIVAIDENNESMNQ